MIKLILTLLNILGAIILFLISYLSLKAYKILRERIFLMLLTSFSLLAASMIGQGLLFLSLYLSHPRRIIMISLTFVSNIVSFIFQITAYIILAISYSKRVRERSLLSLSVLMSMLRDRGFPINLYIFMGGDIICISLLFFIAFQALLIYLENRKINSLLVLTGFAMFGLGHIFRLISLLFLNDTLYIFSRIIYFLGIIPFLAMVIRVNRVK